jgi:PAS domain S-box-containing protein
VNRLFEQTMQVRRQDAVGRSDYELFRADAAESYRSADRRMFETQEAIEVEEFLVCEGQERTYSSTKFPLKDETGVVYAMCGISNDVTERKRAENELRRYTADLEQFAYVVSHDLQEPLRTVKSYVQLLSKRYQGRLDADADEFMSYVTGGVDRMHELVVGLQRYSDLNRRELKQEVADGGAVLRETLRNMQVTIEDAGAEIEYGVLPRVRANASQVGQVLQNLIGNAIKYRSPDAPPRIRITAQAAGAHWEFVVKDNGIGLEMQYAEQIFGVFKRLHGRDIPGTGIGLAICKKIVESYGGRIWVVSSTAAGAEFHFTLPRAE